jgi:two-component system phosphate regulon sensor histidine kinase PhoR
VTLAVCVALVVVTTYQSLKIYESAHAIAADLTQSILTYSHELFTEMYRNSPVPYLLINAEGGIESINFAAARFFQTDINALTEQPIFSFLSKDESSKTALIPEYFAQEKFVSDVDVHIQLPNEEMRWALLSLFSFRDTHHTKKGLLTLIDITKQKQVDKAKTEFVSLASHQLRTPISSMKWNIELLLSASTGSLTSIQSNYLNKIMHSLERMNLLVSDFLSASKFELGTLTPDFTDIAIIPFLTDIYTEHLPFAEQKSVQIETDWAQAPGVFSSDAHMLHMITNNLISNAVKYTPSGGTVYVHAIKDMANLTLTITDTGMGIPAEEQGMIFSKMFRADNARANVPDGTGLGLYIVQGAVNILGGTITFQSKEGVGTSFTVVLPIR